MLALTTAIASACPGRRRPETCWDRDSQLFAVVVGPDGTVWGGGLESSRGGGTLYQVPAGAHDGASWSGTPRDPKGRVEDRPSITSDASTPSCSLGPEAFPADSRDVVLDRVLLAARPTSLIPTSTTLCKYRILVLGPR